MWGAAFPPPQISTEHNPGGGPFASWRTPPIPHTDSLKLSPQASSWGASGAGPQGPVKTSSLKLSNCWTSAMLYNLKCSLTFLACGQKLSLLFQVPTFVSGHMELLYVQYNKMYILILIHTMSPAHIDSFSFETKLLHQNNIQYPWLGTRLLHIFLSTYSPVSLYVTT